MCRMGFRTVKSKCKHRMDVTASLAANKNQRYNTLTSLYELRLYIEISVKIQNTKWMMHSLLYASVARIFLRLSESMLDAL